MQTIISNIIYHLNNFQLIQTAKKYIHHSLYGLFHLLRQSTPIKLKFLISYTLFFDSHYYVEFYNYFFMSYSGYCFLFDDFIIFFDNISLLFTLLTIFISLVCCLILQHTFHQYVMYFFFNILFIFLLLICLFCIANVLHFYMLFELILLPIFFIIGFWGSSVRKIKAVFYLFFFTLFGSFFMFFGLLYLYTSVHSFSILNISLYNFTSEEELFICFCFLMAFLVKIPMFPFYIWLPEAHVEAPTVGSILLAALLLKLGGYGLFRFCIQLFPYGCIYYSIIISVLAIVGCIQASFVIFVQLDIKRIIAYSSIAHMNLVVLGLFSLTYEGVIGSFMLMIGHAFVSSGLFFLAGILYNRSGTRLLQYYSGLLSNMPNFCFFFFIFNLCNLSFPGTANFIAELFIFVGVSHVSFFLFLLTGFSIILSALYSLSLYSRVAFGSIKEHMFFYTNDLTYIETFILLLLVFNIFFWGIFSNFILSFFFISDNFLGSIL